MKANSFEVELVYEKGVPRVKSVFDVDFNKRGEIALSEEVEQLVLTCSEWIHIDGIKYHRDFEEAKIKEGKAIRHLHYYPKN